ncbi:MAG: hypothetical protein WB622_02885 [Acidobacteriaceae bacterium]
MSVISRSDVKTHLSAADTSVYPFGLKRSDVQTDADNHEQGAQAELIDISISPSRPIAPETGPNAQAGGSIGVPAGTEKSGKGSW